MKNIIRQLWLVVSLIVAASVILLISDSGQRTRHAEEREERYPSIAIMQISATTLLDSYVSGVVDRLEEEGMRASDGGNIRFYNPQGDFSTANTMARDIANSPYKIVITASTVALQIFSKANISTKKTHVFGAVTDPYGTGVGITGPGADQHPPYMAGVGTFQPVESAIRIAHEMNPRLKRLGVVWNPGEQCSEACLKKARPVCEDLGIAIVEATATNTSEVAEAARSLIAKGIDAIWVGGDTVATASIRLLINLASEAGIPVFSNDPMDSEKGALFGLGADYYTVGQYAANIAFAILKGKKASDFRIDNVIPEKLHLNRDLIGKLKDRWEITPSVQKLLAQETTSPAEKRLTAEEGKRYRVGLAYFVPAPIFELAIRGFQEKFGELGFVEGQNLDLFMSHSNGDMSLLPQTIKNLVQRDPDILVAMSTPCLSSAIAHSQGLKIAFGVVSAPLEAGAGKGFKDHLPNVTGIVQMIPTEELFDWTQKIFPKAKRIGALYNPSEANAVKEVADLERLLDRRGIELEKVATYNTSEIPESIRALLAKNVDLVFSMGDNTVANGMPSVVKACQRQGVPIIAEDISLMGTGALICCAPGPYSDGRDLAELAARILLGESPAAIPISPGKKNEMGVDLSAMKKAGLHPKVELLKRADVFFHVRSENQPPARIAIVNLVENPALADAVKGVEAALSTMGLREGQDFILKKYCAQGEISQLSQILDKVEMDRPDVLITVTTPAFIAAVNKKLPFPLVFTVASDPVRLGLFKGGRPDNICGVHDDPPVDKVLEMARMKDPSLDAVGIVYDASQVNSLISVEKLRRSGKDQGVKILEATASTVSELSLSVESLIQRGAKALILSADNLVATGFPAIHKVARSAGMPIYVTDIDLVKKGADGGVGDSYFEWGMQSGRMAARIVAGVPANLLPVMPTESHKRIAAKNK